MKKFKKIMAMIVAINILCVCLASCGNKGDESSINENSSGTGVGANIDPQDPRYRGRDSSKPIDAYNKPLHIDTVGYIPPWYPNDFDPALQTLSLSNYYKLRLAVQCWDGSSFRFERKPESIEELPIHIENASGPRIAFSHTLVDLKSYSKTNWMIIYMCRYYQGQTFTEKQLKEVLEPLFWVTAYDIYLFKRTQGIDWQPLTNTFTFYDADNALYPDAADQYNNYLGYRDMGNGRYEFYYGYANYQFLSDDYLSRAKFLNIPEEELFEKYYAPLEKDGVIELRSDLVTMKYQKVTLFGETHYIAYTGEKNPKEAMRITLEAEMAEDGSISKIRLVDRCIVDTPSSFSKAPTA